MLVECSKTRKPGYRSILDRAIFKMALALCLPTCFVANAQHSSEHGQRQYAYDTADVSLEGKLVEKSAYGPPGFGETPKKDLLEKFLVIRVDDPLLSDRERAPIRTTRQISTVRPTLPKSNFFSPTSRDKHFGETCLGKQSSRLEH